MAFNGKKMKRYRLFAVLAVIALLITVVNAAENESFGFYGIGEYAGVTVMPYTADGLTAEAVTADADGDGAYDCFYPGSDCLEVTVDDAPRGQYLIRVISSDGVIKYINQSEGSGRLTFDVSFELPDVNTGYVMYITCDSERFTAAQIPFSFAPSVHLTESGDAERLPGDEWRECSRDRYCIMSSYTDLDAGAWYHDGVHYVLENGIMNGYDGGIFAPDAPTSRAMLVTMLWRMEGMPEAGSKLSFDDVSASSWYAGAVRWAVSAKIVEGYSASSFGPDDSVSREQLAVILWRYEKLKGRLNENSSVSMAETFSDSDEISSWAEEAVNWAAASGLINGVGNNRLSPKTSASRAQVATILMRSTGNRSAAQ